ncbi:hypothetical protein [Saccharothrix variisporea]|uniref:Putative peptidase inhibitor domain-containing protein n=1 Tax=Saccharothrix variisporea TaxID=543527 RepID=A0A495XEW6_9PSEU|nr:hypothetical protein [Saccharothrix variisporea]RKT72557.1 hypothetical protein DFJ66_5872 [Saccharothrix variisporea]
MRRIVVVACFALVGCGAPAPEHASTAPTTAVVPTTTSEVQMPAKLSPQGKEVLARAQRSGVPNVVLVISTEANSTERTASALRGLGATVEATDTSIGYIRVTVPVADVERVVAADGVRQVDVDEPLSNADPTP